MNNNYVDKYQLHSGFFLICGNNTKKVTFTM